ncbi:MAG: hypothetical protein ABRQ26_07020 [Syntrophomonadaceae bacterium]
MIQFFRKENGNITLFLAIVIVFFFFFDAILIDYARILAASKETENAAQASVRSVLSNYDSKLQKDYGLFGVSQKGGSQQTVQSVVKGNLSGYLTGNSYTFIDTRLESAGLSTPIMMSNQPYFEQQILEDMKYKAPIELILDIIDKFDNGDIKKDLEDGDNLKKNAEEMSKLIKKRHEKIQEISPIFQQSMWSDGVLQQVKDRLIGNVQGEMSLNFIDKTVGIISDAREINRQIAELEKNFPKTDEKETIKYAYDDKQFIDYTDDILQWESFIKGLNEVEKMKEHTAAEHNSSSIGNQTNLYGDLKTKTLGFLGWDDQQYESWKSSNNKSDDDARNAAKKEQADDPCEQTIDPEKIGKAVQDTTDAVAAFEALRGIDRYGSSGQEIFETDTKQLEADAFSKALKIFTGDGIKSLLLGARNELFVNEYSMLRFSCHTKKMDSHKIKGEEAEYVLYGIPYAGANFGAACGEIYAIRFAIRFVEGLKKFRAGAANPVALVSAATIYAASMAAYDLNRLISGKDVEISSLTEALKKIKLNYQDYLRIFLFIQSNEQQKLARMQSLIDLNTGTDLTKTPVYAECEAKTSIRLWFIPGVMKALNIGGGEIQGNRAYITRKACMFY